MAARPWMSWECSNNGLYGHLIFLVCIQRSLLPTLYFEIDETKHPFVLNVIQASFRTLTLSSYSYSLLVLLLSPQTLLIWNSSTLNSSQTPSPQNALSARPNTHNHRLLRTPHPTFSFKAESRESFFHWILLSRDSP
jgi:hypothetical protein